MVDYLVADFGNPVNIGFPGPEITALYHIIKKPVDVISVILVVLGGIDPSLCRNGVSPSRRVLVAENLHTVAELAQ